MLGFVRIPRVGCTHNFAPGVSLFRESLPIFAIGGRGGYSHAPARKQVK